MWPGSAAARFFGGFGAGRALVEIDCEVVDAQKLRRDVARLLEHFK